jgi:hypothetical protein
LHIVGGPGTTLDDLGVAPEVRDPVAAVVAAEPEHVAIAPVTVRRRGPDGCRMQAQEFRRGRELRRRQAVVLPVLPRSRTTPEADLERGAVVDVVLRHSPSSNRADDLRNGRVDVRASRIEIGEFASSNWSPSEQGGVRSS